MITALVMLNLVRGMTRLRVLGVMLLALAFVLPAMSSHACAPAPSDVVQITDAGQTEPNDDPCQDCGPACANGHCHAPHPAIVGDGLAMMQPAATFAMPLSWSHSPLLAPSPPDGPERPPRA